MKKKPRKPSKYSIQGMSIHLNFHAVESLRKLVKTATPKVIAIDLPRCGFVWEMKTGQARRLADWLIRAADYVEYMNG